MTKWRGFWKESYEYMGIATATPDEVDEFYRRYPRAWLRFHWLCLGDALRGLVWKLARIARGRK